jgi:hypothetical protein
LPILQNFKDLESIAYDLSIGKRGRVRKQLSTQTRITTTMRRKDGKIIRIRKSSKAEPSHQAIYDALELPHQPGRTTKSIL